MSSPLRIGVIGLGRAFSLMLPTFLSDPRVQLVAASDPRTEARKQFAFDFECPVYEHAEELANDGSVQAIYIASPHQYHAQHTILAAKHGKHVLVEKPMALNLADCDAMINACADAGVYLLVGHCHSFDAPYLHTRNLIARGDLGKVTMIQAQNFTDWLYRPRRPEELNTDEGGGVIFSQAAHQVDIVRMLASQRPTHLRCVLGNWDPSRPTEGAYSSLLWFEGGAHASLSYNGYAHFDSDEWMGWVGEMGNHKSPDRENAARHQLQAIRSTGDESQLKASRTYGGSEYKLAATENGPPLHQHFGPIIVSCEHGDVRPMPDGIRIYGDSSHSFIPLTAPATPRAEVVTELYKAVTHNIQPLHTGAWAKNTVEICLAMLESHRTDADVILHCS